jgi:hypothetical protein
MCLKALASVLSVGQKSVQGMEDYLVVGKFVATKNFGTVFW